MADEATVEISIGTKNERVIREVERALADVNPQRWKDSRDLVTILAVSAGVAKLISALLELKEHFAKKKNAEPPPQIVINNINRQTILLTDATPERLRKLLKEAQL